VREVWTEALTLHRIRYETRVLNLKEHEHAVEGATSKKRDQPTIAYLLLLPQAGVELDWPQWLYSENGDCCMK
jgi:hypothetical protein